MLAVNVSTEEIRRGGVEQRLGRFSPTAVSRPQRLELEITESGLMEKGEGRRPFLRRSATAGRHLSIDDFGTGYFVARLPQALPCLQAEDRSQLHSTSRAIRTVSNSAATIVAMARSSACRCSPGASKPRRSAPSCWISSAGHTRLLVPAHRCLRTSTRHNSCSKGGAEATFLALAVPYGAFQADEGWPWKGTLIASKSVTIDGDRGVFCDLCLRGGKTPDAQAVSLLRLTQH